MGLGQQAREVVLRNEKTTNIAEFPEMNGNMESGSQHQKPSFDTRGTGNPSRSQSKRAALAGLRSPLATIQRSSAFPAAPHTGLKQRKTFRSRFTEKERGFSPSWIGQGPRS